MSDDFVKTQRYGFFKPISGTMNWADLFNLNWDMVDALLSRQEAAIDDLNRQTTRLRNQIIALTPETPDDDD
jgi:hypothetical protein